ncbi:endospore germination permease [Alicyclobacillus sp. SO9]|uniref:GerAB/ArcD/ProY family transporter n=1 Tax=Alicyclobacillus sp. SO9 TaxID=2665646 RepID=UPI0018E7EBD9|nr:endospore germination permease [Alicyclobacillus sp. SO9]
MGDKLSRLQVANLTFWIVMGTGVLALPATTGYFTARNGWISALVASSGGFVSIGIVFIYSRVFPGVDLLQSFESAFGRWFGAFAGLWYVLWLFITISGIWRELSVFIEVTAYQKTPLIVLSAVLVIPIVYIIYQGIQTVGMFSEFLTPLATGFTFLFVVLTVSNIDWSQFRPILADGWTPVLRGSLVSTTFAMEPLILLQAASKVDKPNQMASSMFVAYSGILALSLLIEVVAIGTLGGAIQNLNYPILEVIRNVSFLKHFVERIDTFYVMAVVAVLFLKLSMFQYVFATSISQIFRLTHYRTIAWISTIMTWSGSVVLFRDSRELAELILFVLPAYFTLTLAGLPLLSMTAKHIRKIISSPKSTSH